MSGRIVSSRAAQAEPHAGVAARYPDATSWAMAATAAVGLAGFAILTALLWARVTLPFDAPMRNAALQWRALSSTWDLISNAANFPLIGIAVGIVAWLLWKRRRRDAILVAITLGLVTAGSEAVKQLVHRDRPPDSQTVVPGVIYSYPSGHELEAIAILGIVALLVWRSRAPRVLRVAFATAVALFCAAVAFARVAINAHWPSDVLGGVLGGVGVLALVALMTRDSAGSAAYSAADPAPARREA